MRAAQITLDALGTMFSKAKDVMNWLTACARVIATSGEPVSWHTPLGLPIVQPYRRKARAFARCSSQRCSSLSMCCGCRHGTARVAGLQEMCVFMWASGQKVGCDAGERSAVSSTDSFWGRARQDVAHVVTVLQRLVLRTTKDSPVDRIRQASAFPPNYIHCIDSSHMMLTALACQRNGAPSCLPACCRSLACWA